MNYAYGAVWLIVAFLLIFKLSKENKLFIFLGSFFIIMGAWWIIDAAMPELLMFEGTYGLILRGLGLIWLIITGVYYYKEIYTKRGK